VSLLLCILPFARSLGCGISRALPLTSASVVLMSLRFTCFLTSNKSKTGYSKIWFCQARKRWGEPVDQNGINTSRRLRPSEERNDDEKVYPYWGILKGMPDMLPKAAGKSKGENYRNSLAAWR
jgi:hypothetical protein